MNSNIYIIGCGGVGSWLTPALTLLTSPQQITLLDADKLEEKNMDRQLFRVEDIGRSKAEALAERYQCNFRDEWFSEGLMEFEPEDWIISCVDNHLARRAALGECDRYGCRAIFAANETHSAEAYYYQQEWKGTPIDPRVYFPDILTDRSNDPRQRVMGCTGEVQQANPQLVTSNALAASLAGHLFALWHLKAPGFKAKTVESLPYRLVANMSRLETHLIKDKINQINKGQENEHRTSRPILSGIIHDTAISGGGSDSGRAEQLAEVAGAAASTEH